MLCYIAIYIYDIFIISEVTKCCKPEIKYTFIFGIDNL